jgi:GTPase
MMDADLAERVRGGDRRALARALSVVENDAAGREALLRALAASVGRAHRVGVTGPPGAGKSTLVAALATAWRKAGRQVGVLAVDPSSPFTGGALLGDRIRMGMHAGDEGVFIRSLATRGAAGGISAAAEDAADVLDAAGFDLVLTETVGVGQAELEVAEVADTTVLVLAPGSGDEVQAMKAGLLEAADVVVVNQGDRPDAEATRRALENALALRDREAPPVLVTIATRGDGVEALRELLDERAAPAARAALAARRLGRARRRVRLEADRLRAEAFWSRHGTLLDRLAGEVAAGRTTAAGAAARLVQEAGR